MLTGSFDDTQLAAVREAAPGATVTLYRDMAAAGEALAAAEIVAGELDPAELPRARNSNGCSGPPVPTGSSIPSSSPIRRC